MSDSQVIARRFRPQTFDQVVGQDVITRTLRNAIESGRLHHAYVFAGARGVGKTTTARILAKALNCLNGPTTQPCGVCPACEDITRSRPSYVIEIDAASNTGVDNVRNVIIESAAIAPPEGRYKVFIIDEVHQLSGAAFNALLKTLEEPPPRVLFILATTELHKVPDTILSRSQVFEFRTIPVGRITEQLRGIADDLGISIGDSALLAIARAGEGSMRDAQSALDQVISFAGSTVTDGDVSAALGLVDIETLNTTLQAIAEQNAKQLLGIVEDVVARGCDLRNFCREMMSHVRAVLIVEMAGFNAELLQMPESEAPVLEQLAECFSEQDLLRFFSILTKTEQDVRLSSHPRFQLEIGLVRLVHAGRINQLEHALSRMEEIYRRLGGEGTATDPEGSRPALPSFSQRSVTEASPPSRFPRRTTGTTPPRGSGPRAAIGPTPVSAVDRSSPRTDPSPEGATGAATARAPRTDETPEIGRIKSVLESKGKMLVLSAMEHAEQIVLDGGDLCISYAPSDAAFKAQLDSKTNRKVIEEACQEALGTEASVSVRVAEATAAPGRPAATADDSVTLHPGIMKLLEKTHGRIVEVVNLEEEEGDH